MEFFNKTGFCIVPGAVSDRDVASLLEECDLLHREHTAKGHSLLESGCVMDLFRHVTISDSSPCRQDRKAYLKLRRDTTVVRS